MSSKQDELLVVYTPGKVMGSSITKSLAHHNIENYHIHVLRKNKILEIFNQSLAHQQIPNTHIGSSI